MRKNTLQYYGLVSDRSSKIKTKEIEIDVLEQQKEIIVHEIQKYGI